MDLVTVASIVAGVIGVVMFLLKLVESLINKALPREVDRLLTWNVTQADKGEARYNECLRELKEIRRSLFRLHG